MRVTLTVHDDRPGHNRTETYAVEHAHASMALPLISAVLVSALANHEGELESVKLMMSTFKNMLSGVDPDHVTTVVTPVHPVPTA